MLRWRGILLVWRFRPDGTLLNVDTLVLSNLNGYLLLVEVYVLSLHLQQGSISVYIVYQHLDPSTINSTQRGNYFECSTILKDCLTETTLSFFQYRILEDFKRNSSFRGICSAREIIIFGITLR